MFISNVTEQYLVFTRWQHLNFSFNYSFIHSFIAFLKFIFVLLSFILAYTYSPLHLLIHPCIYLFILAFTYSLFYHFFSRKELILCHKLWFSNPYIFKTQCRKPLIIQTYIIGSITAFIVWNIKGLQHWNLKI